MNAGKGFFTSTAHTLTRSPLVRRKTSYRGSGLDRAMTRSSRDLIESRATVGWCERLKLIIDTSHKSNSVGVRLAGRRVRERFGRTTKNATRDTPARKLVLDRPSATTRKEKAQPEGLSLR